jgi:hypothetical protein
MLPSRSVPELPVSRPQSIAHFFEPRENLITKQAPVQQRRSLNPMVRRVSREEPGGSGRGVVMGKDMRWLRSGLSRAQGSDSHRLDLFIELGRRNECGVEGEGNVVLPLYVADAS